MLESVRKRKGHWESFDDIDGLEHECECLLEDREGNIWIGTYIGVDYYDGESLSYNIVKAHGGDLNFTSEPEKGTEIVLTLPVNHNAEEVIP